MAAYYWVDGFARGGIPTTALDGGADIDGHQIYVGRAYHKGDLLPAKVIPGRFRAYVASNGLEHVKEKFQVLCEQRFDWIDTKNKIIPEGAVVGGRTANGEPLYIGRVTYKEANIIGKVSKGICSIPFAGKELQFNEFEVLVLRF